MHASPRLLAHRGSTACPGRGLASNAVWKKIDPCIPQNVYHVARRRREEAVAVHIIATNRLNMNNITWLRSLRGTANAYPSLNHSDVLDAITEAPNPEHDIVVQSVESNIFTIEAQNQISYLRGGGTGVFDGSSAGASLFNLDGQHNKHGTKLDAN